MKQLFSQQVTADGPSPSVTKMKATLHLKRFFIMLLAMFAMVGETWADDMQLTLSTTANLIKRGSDTWTAGLAGSKANAWSLPTATSVATYLGATTYTSSGTGFYWGKCNGNDGDNNDLTNLTATGFSYIGRQAYTGEYAAQIYDLTQDISRVTVAFTLSDNVSNASFSIWGYDVSESTATCLASSTSSWTTGDQVFSASNFSLSSGDRLILIWNANNYGQKTTISNFSGVAGTGDVSTDTWTYNVTDVAGTTYTGTYTGAAYTLPTFTGVSGYTLSNSTWDTSTKTYTGTITFPFKVSKSDLSTANYIFLYSLPSGCKAHWYVKSSDSYVYALNEAKDNSMPTNQSGEIDKWEWAIIPVFSEGAFSFKIYNKSKALYVNSASDGATVTLSSDGTAFTYGSTNVNSGNGFLLSNTAYCLSVGSNASEQKVNSLALASYTSHKGFNIGTEDPTDFTSLMTALTTAYNNASAITTGTGVGDYSATTDQQTALTTAITNAKPVVEGTSYLTAADFTTYTTALTSAVSALGVVAPTDGTVYNINSLHADGSKMYLYYDATNSRIGISSTLNASDNTYCWTAVADGDNFKLQNVANTDVYIGYCGVTTATSYPVKMGSVAGTLVLSSGSNYIAPSKAGTYIASTDHVTSITNSYGNYSTDFQFKDVNTATYTVTVTGCTETGAGLVYGGKTYADQTTFEAPNTLTTADLSVAPVTSYTGVVSMTDNAITVTYTLQTSNYTVVVSGTTDASAGVKYGETTYINNGTFTAPQGLTASSFTAVAISGYYTTISVSGTTITVLYERLCGKIADLEDGALYIIKNVNTASKERQGYCYMGDNYAMRIQTDTASVNRQALSADYLVKLTKNSDGTWQIAYANGTGRYWPTVPSSGNMTASTTAGAYTLTDMGDDVWGIKMQSTNYINSNTGYVSGWSGGHAMEFWKVDDTMAETTLNYYELDSTTSAGTATVSLPSTKTATTLTYKANVPDGRAYSSVTGGKCLLQADVRPVDGKIYYIYNSNTATTSAINNYYLYSNQGALAINTASKVVANNYRWIVAKNTDGTYTVKNAESGKYLRCSSLNAEAKNLTITQTTAYEDGFVTIYGYCDASKGDRYMCYSNGTNATVNQSTGTYNKVDYSSDFFFEEATGYNAYNVVIKGAPTTITAEVTITESDNTTESATNGGIITAAATPTVGTNVTATTLTGYDVNITYDADTKTITATYTLNADAILTSADAWAESGQTNVKWVRISNIRNNYAAHAAKLQTAMLSEATDVTNAGEIFALVGTSLDNFQIYSKVNSTAAFGYDATTSGSAVTMDGATKTFKAVFNSTNSYAGYNIVPTDNANMSFNMCGGAGYPIKFYSSGDGGSTWAIELIGQTPTITVALSGTPNANNSIVGKLAITYGAKTSTTTYTTASTFGKQTIYLPSGIDVSASATTPFRGYTVATSGSLTDESGETVTFTVDTDNKAQYLAYSTGSAHPYRIPAITTAQNGDLIAVYDYRPCGNDIGYGETDLVGRRSTDNGETWSDQFMVADGSGVNSNTFGTAYGDAALIADRESNKVLVMSVSGQCVYSNATATNKPMVARTISEDGGKTWNTPQDVTDNFWYTGTESGNHIFMTTENSTEYVGFAGFFGSGRIVQSSTFKKSGSQYYRLYAAMLARGTNIQGAYVVYSDDFGETWSLLDGELTAKPLPNSDEPKVELLPSGQLVLSGRKYYGRYFNVFTFSDEENGKGSWSTQVISNDQTGGISVGNNACNGEIYVIKAKKTGDDTVYDLVLQSLPSANSRANVEIWYKDITANNTAATGFESSTAFAQNWTKGYQVSSTSSAYSTMTMQGDGKLAFFFEEGPGGYEMVYVPLDIATITNNTYSEIVMDYETPLATAIAQAEALITAAKADENYGKVGYAPSTAQIGTLEVAITTAQAAVGSATQADVTAIVNAINAYNASTAINLPTEGMIITIQNKDVAGNAPAMQYLYTNTASNKMQLNSKANAGENAYFLVGTDTDGNLTLKSLGSSLYVGSETESTVQKATTTSAPITITGSADNGYVLLQAGTADANYMYLTGWQPVLSTTATTEWFITDATSEYMELKKTEVANLLSAAGKVGYPTTTCEAYTNLSTEQESFNAMALAEQVSELSNLATIVSAYKSATDIVMPEDGHVYTIKSYIMNGDVCHYLYNKDASSTATGTFNVTSEVTDQGNYWKAVAGTSTSQYTFVNGYNHGLGFQIIADDATFTLSKGVAFGTFSLYGNRTINSTGNRYMGMWKDVTDSNLTTAFGLSKTDGTSNSWSTDWIIEDVTDHIYFAEQMSDEGDATGTFTWTSASDETNTYTAPLTGFIVLPNEAAAAEFSTSNTVTTATGFDSSQQHLNITEGIASNYKTAIWAYGTLATTSNSDDALANIAIYLPKAGTLGYPKTTSEGYIALNKANTEINAGTNQTVTTGYLEVLYNNYIEETDVVVPEAGHVYYFESAMTGTGVTQRYVVDANDGYNANPVKGFVNNLESQAKPASGYLQNGGYWMCVEKNANGAIFKSALGNFLGDRAIATGQATAQRFTFGRTNTSGTDGFGKLYMRQGTSGNYFFTWNDGKSGSLAAGLGANGTQVHVSGTRNSDWVIGQAEDQYVYPVSVTSDKPSTYDEIKYNVVVTMTGKVGDVDFKEKTSGVGFFVVDDNIINGTANAACTPNNLSTDFYQLDAATEANRPTAVIDQTNKQIAVTYKFDYSTAVPAIYTEALALSTKTGFGYPTSTATSRTTFAAAVESFYTKYHSGDSWSSEAIEEAAYNTLANAMTTYYTSTTDNDIVLPANGTPVLLENVFTHPTTGTEYINYAYNVDTKLKLGMTSAQKTALGSDYSKVTNIVDANGAQPTNGYMWAIQRDNDTEENRKITTTTAQTENGTETQTDQTSEEIATYSADNYSSYTATTEETDEDTSTDVTTGPVVVNEGKNGAKSTVTTTTTSTKVLHILTTKTDPVQGTISWTQGVDDVANGKATLTGSATETSTKTVKKVIKTVISTESTTTTSTYAKTSDTSMQEGKTYYTLADDIYTAFTGESFESGTDYYERTDQNATASGMNDPTYALQTTTYNVVDYNDVVTRTYPTYYISSCVGDGCIGRQDGGNTACCTNNQDLRFNVTFVRGTKLGTVGMLFLFHSNGSDASAGTPRYIVGDLSCEHFDRYNIQTGYNTTGATSIDGVWSTDWNFVQAQTVDTHKDGDNISVGGVAVTDASGNAVTTSDGISAWTQPYFNGKKVRFYASDKNVVGEETNESLDAANSYSSLNLPYAVVLPTDGTVQDVYVVTGAQRVYKDHVAVSSRTTLTLTSVKDNLTLSDGKTIVIPREFPVIIKHNNCSYYWYAPTSAYESLQTNATKLSAIEGYR